MTPNQIAFLSPIVLRRMLAGNGGRFGLDGFLFTPDSRPEVQHFATFIAANTSKQEQVKALRSALIRGAKFAPELRDARPTVRIERTSPDDIMVSLWTYGSVCRCDCEDYQ